MAAVMLSTPGSQVFLGARMTSIQLTPSEVDDIFRVIADTDRRIRPRSSAEDLRRGGSGRASRHAFCFGNGQAEAGRGRPASHICNRVSSRGHPRSKLRPEQHTDCLPIVFRVSRAGKCCCEGVEPSSAERKWRSQVCKLTTDDEEGLQR